VAVGHAKNVIRLRPQSPVSWRLRCLKCRCPVPLPPDGVGAGRLPFHGADSRRHDLDVPPSFHDVAENAFTMGLRQIFPVQINRMVFMAASTVSNCGG